MASIHLSDALLQQLEQRASQENITLAELLQRWLDVPVMPAAPAALPDWLDTRALEMSNASILIVDALQADTPIVYCNAAFEQLTGYMRAEVLGKSCRILQGIDNQQPGLDVLRAAIEHQQAAVVTLRNYRKDGSLFWNDLHIAPIFDANGKLTHMIGVQHDITPMKQYEEQQSRQDRQFAIGPVVFMRWNRPNNSPVFRETYVSPNIERFGYPAEEFTSGRRRLVDIIHPDDVNRVLHEIDAIRAARGPFSATHYRIMTASGEVRWIYEYSLAIYDDPNETSRGYLLDITDMKTTEDTLRSNEAFLSSIFQSSLNGIMVFRAVRDDSGQIIDFEWVMLNAAMERITGVPAEDLTGKRQLELYPYDRTNGIFDHFVHVVETGEPRTFEQFVDLPQARWGLYSAVKLEDGVVVGYNDITDLKLADEALRSNEAFLSTILESSLNGIMVFRAIRGDDNRIIDFEWVMVNPAMEKIAGLPASEMIGTRQLTLYPADRTNGIFDHFVQVVETGEPHTFEQYFPTSQRHALFSVVRLEDGVAVGYNDITGLKTTDEALRQAKNNYDELVARIPGMVYRLRTYPDGRTVYEYISPRVREFHGLTPEEVYTNGLALMEQLDPEDVHTALTIASTASEIPEPVVWEGRYNVNGSVRWLRRESRPQLMDDGSVIWNGIELDMTLEIEARQARADAQAAVSEQERLEAMLHQEQRTGNQQTQLIRTLSHEFRTPLAIMTTSLNILEHYFERLAPEERLRRIGNIHFQIRQLTILLDDTTETLRSMVHGAGFNPHPVNLEQLCQVILNEIQNTLAENHHLVFVSDGQVANALIDDRLISRVLVNLLTNAVKYSPTGTEIRLELAQISGAIVLRVIDQGMGIAPADIGHLFEPFFRAKNVLSLPGTGLGLPIVKDCVELHGGTIQVDSVVGKGTTFTVYLPN